MKFRTKIIITLLFVSFAANAGTALAADNALTKSNSETDKFPYIASSISDNVNIRSGGGTAFYSCGKLKQGQKVTVVGKEFNWLKIVPPLGSFSWISKRYVEVDPANPKVGKVTGNNVRVWVGSPLLGALTSSTSQAKLSKDNFDTVQLLDVEDEGYLKIAPPSGAYLYVRNDNLKYVGTVKALEEIIPDKPPVKVEISDSTKTPAAVNTTKVPKSVEAKPDQIFSEEIKQPEEAKTTSPMEIGLVDKYKALFKKIDAERKKPLADQNYEEMKKEVKTILAQGDSDKAKAYAEYLNDLIGRFELAILVVEETKRQEEELANKIKGIQDKHAQKVANIDDPGKFIVTGVLKPSNVFNAQSGIQRYRICQDDGKTICYAQPAGAMPKNLIFGYYNKKVALVGTTVPKFFSTVGLVRFTDIVDAATIEKASN